MIGRLKALLKAIDPRGLAAYRPEALGVLAFIAVSVFFYKFVFLHNRAEIADLDAEIEASRAETFRINAEIKSSQGLEGAVQEAVKGLAAMEGKLKGLNQRLPSDRHISMLLAEFTTGAQDGLRIVSIKPLQPEDKGELARLPFQITLETRFVPLGNYIERIENLPRLMVVDNVSIEPKEEGSSILNANITLSAYVMGYGGSN